jgi:hypothetical protein
MLYQFEKVKPEKTRIKPKKGGGYEDDDSGHYQQQSDMLHKIADDIEISKQNIVLHFNGLIDTRFNDPKGDSLQTIFDNIEVERKKIDDLNKLLKTELEQMQ